MQPNEIEELLEKYNQGSATPEEIALVETWYLRYNNTTPDLSHQQLEKDEQESTDALLLQINKTDGRNYRPALAIAASLLIFLTSALFFVFHKQQQQLQTVKKSLKTDITPGGNRALLTLSNGSTVILTGAKNGKIANQAGVIINKTADGLIKYDNPISNSMSQTTVYNTVTTPRGGQYQLVLSDGTKVWLNSASSIKYPVEYTNNERRVELTGEAYFEVAHDVDKPFRVMSKGQTVEVLGTHFNVNAYNDEDIVKTTLLQGSVKVITDTKSSIVKPGEQARLKDGNIRLAEVNADEAVAWKNGFFYFDDNNIQEVMKQLARWYDVDVKYDGQPSDRLFSGEISRNVNASQILDILSFKKVHYRIHGKTITLTP